MINLAKSTPNGTISWDYKNFFNNTILSLRYFVSTNLEFYFIRLYTICQWISNFQILFFLLYIILILSIDNNKVNALWKICAFRMRRLAAFEVNARGRGLWSSNATKRLVYGTLRNDGYYPNDQTKL